VVQGHLDYGLSELGRQQAAATAARLASAKPGRVVASPLTRALQTAEAIAAVHGLDVEAEPALLEYDIGSISGLTGAQIRQRHPEMLEQYARGERPTFPGEEGRDVFLARVSALLGQLRGSEGTVIAVAHGGVVGALCYAALGMDYRRPGMFQVANCSITEILEDRGGNLILLRHNDICHLGELVTTHDRG
jgi:probable phosphoglycerate mutase